MRGRRSRPRLALGWSVLLFTVLACVVAGCGSGSDASRTSTSTTPRQAKGATTSSIVPADETTTEATVPVTADAPTTEVPTTEVPTTASPTTAARPPADSTVFFAPCYYPGDPLVARPTEVLWGCDGTGLFRNLSWTRWEDGTAVATGVSDEHGCDPSCAEGAPHTYKVQIVLNDSTITSCGRFYRTMGIFYDGDHPDSAEFQEGTWAVNRATVPTVDC